MGRKSRQASEVRKRKKEEKTITTQLDVCRPAGELLYISLPVCPATYTPEHHLIPPPLLDELLLINKIQKTPD